MKDLVNLLTAWGGPEFSFKRITTTPLNNCYITFLKTRWVSYLYWYLSMRFNRPFTSFPKPLFQSEAECKALDMKMIFFSLMQLQIKLIFTTQVLPLASFWLMLWFPGWNRKVMWLNLVRNFLFCVKCCGIRRFEVGPHPNKETETTTRSSHQHLTNLISYVVNKKPRVGPFTWRLITTKPPMTKV